MAQSIILKSISSSYVSLIMISMISLSKCDPLIKSTTTGFTIDLIHRDSPQSPSYNPSFSPSQRLANMLRRSLKRAQRLNSTARSPEPDIINASGEYFMKYSIGTPPVPSLGIADTGSDLIWTQCHPCHQGFNQTLPIFNPKTSSTYKKIPCSALRCSSFPETSCSRSRKNCLYSGAYGDGSFTKGELSTDTITLASSPGGENTVSIPNVVLGCGFKNGIKFEGGESGIIGLGGGKVSFVRQLGSLAQGKFSYCFVSFSEKSKLSKLSFGANAVVSGRRAVSTRLVPKKTETFYYTTLEGISVGNRRLGFYDEDHGEGNIIVDSGTTLTMLPEDFYGKLREALASEIKLEQIRDPQGVLDLCFFSRRDDVVIPDIVVHFKGADLKWKQDNVLVRTSDDCLCLAALPTVQNVGTYGNLAQVNFLVGYDLDRRTVSFKPSDCGK